MEIRQLKYFVRTAETGSISGAAVELHMTQPALSRQLAELEKELGGALLQRNPRGVTLTTLGHVIKTHADTILAQVDRTPELVRLAAGSRSLIRLGAPPGLPHDWFRAAVQTVESAGLAVRFSLYEASSDEQSRLLRAGQIDLALLHTEPAEGINGQHLLTQPLGAAVRPTSPLSTRDVLGLFDLDGLTVMAHAAGEIRIQEVKLRSAAEAEGVRTHWVFRRFSHHSLLIADLADADAALTTEASAGLNFPGWKWVPLTARDAAGHSLQVETWAAWNAAASPEVRKVADLFRSTPVQVLDGPES
ncbi:LysR family transcriptional regulator [Arthrobacter sp. zg-Y1110]|uniref:LysR family transcriptional regulator n=1 Tax=Arthrobacter sp. zg-Y1110 TaxID=2886932 RepID=UPI001D137ACF|nr:LysR family transcriptional regulator [Arthrobacter sp. zg-Y1110]MCC3291758.1 LysR family transcriptional regulator [Arthrobacter sp. zg-Y1110]UWX85594.1 LysR family transcriptional regulator [Arthrobacter sp. zg-Y1110]